MRILGLRVFGSNPSGMGPTRAPPLIAGPAPSDRLALGPTILLALRDIGIHLNPHQLLLLVGLPNL